MTTGQKKRFRWREETMVSVLKYMIDQHKEFISAKKNGSTQAFLNEVGKIVGTEGSAVDNMLKNIGKENRDIVRQTKTSGVATDDVQTKPRIRDSELIFELYETYYAIYYPKGGSIRPDVVVTPAGVTRPVVTVRLDSAAPEGSRPMPYGDDEQLDLSPASQTPNFSPVPSTARQECSSQTGVQMPTLGHPFGVGASRKRDISATPRMAADSGGKKAKTGSRTDFLDTSVDYQRQHVELMREQNAILQSLVNEVRVLKSAFLMTHGIHTENVEEGKPTGQSSD